MTRFADSERQSLCDTFERVGPDAPTLCSPWLTRDLAAHLVVRERRPDVSAAIWLPAMSGRLKRVQDGYAGWDWQRLVHEVRSGPPVWSPTSLGRVDEAINTAEFFVHHEDVLRGAGTVHHEDVLRGGAGTAACLPVDKGMQACWTARKLPCDLETALWGIVTKVARLQLARARVGIVLSAPSYGERQVHATTDLGEVVVTGTPGELLLYSFGRREVAQVDITGPQTAQAAL